MKYKDRKQAKRKYKQMLLVTSAALTLGLGVVGSVSMVPTAAHAAVSEDDARAMTEAQSKIAELDEYLKSVQPKPGIGGYVDGYKDFMTNGGQKLVDAVAAIGPTIFDSIRSKEPMTDARLNNIMKNLTLAGVSMIPYAGGIASSIIGMFWPTLGGIDPVVKLREEMTKLINQTVTASEKNFMLTRLTTATNGMKGIDDALHGKTGSFDPDNAPAGTQKTQVYTGSTVLSVNTAFTEILNQIEGSQFKADLLPLYTKVATMHLIYLKFISANKTHSEINMTPVDENNFKQQLGNKTVRELAIKYRDFIDKTAQKKEEENRKAPLITVDGKSTDPLLYYANQTEQNKEFKETSKAIIGKEEINVPVGVDVTLSTSGKMLSASADNTDKLAFDATTMTNDQKFSIQYVNQYENIVAIRSNVNGKYISFDTYQGYPNNNNFANMHCENTGYKATLIKLVPVKDDSGNVVPNKFMMRALNSYLDSYVSADFNNGGKLNAHNRQVGNSEIITIEKVAGSTGTTGWESNGDKWYYLESGVKATGFKQIQGQWYYLNPADGTLVTGIRRIDGNLYDFKATSATSATDAPKGSMLTGWQKEGDTWFYFNPEEGGPKGAAKTGWFKSADGKWYYLDPGNDGASVRSTQMKIGDKVYNFDANGACVNP